MASTSAQMRMKNAATRKMPMLTRRPANTLGSASSNFPESKNVRWSVGQPGALTMIQMTTPNTTRVLIVATSTATPRDRQGERRGAIGAGPVGSAVTTAPPCHGSLQDGESFSAADVHVVDGLERAVGLDDRDRLVDARDECAALLEHQPHLVDLLVG